MHTHRYAHIHGKTKITNTQIRMLTYNYKNKRIKMHALTGCPYTQSLMYKHTYIQAHMHTQKHRYKHTPHAQNQHFHMRAHTGCPFTDPQNEVR